MPATPCHFRSLPPLAQLFLSAADYESHSAPKTGRPSQKAAEPKAKLLDLHDDGAETAVARPASKPAAPPVARAPSPGSLLPTKAPAAYPIAPAPAATVKTGTGGARKRARSGGPAKLFVLDTNVLLHDPMSLFRFEEHDVYLPMITLEELDNHKKGMTEVARNGAFKVSRDLDSLATEGSLDPATGIPLAKTGHKDARGNLFFQTQFLDAKAPSGLPQGKADNQILAVVQALREQHAPRDVVLVSKDINMRVKARALGLPAEDYFNDKTLEDGDLLYTGVLALPADFWEKHGKTMESWNQGGYTFYRIVGPLVPSLLINQFVFLETPGAAPLYARVTEITGKSAVLKTLRGLCARQERRVGHHRAQPRAELRHQPADGSGCRLRHPHRHGRHRQDARDARLRPRAGDGRAALQRDLRLARHGAGGRRHRLPAGHRRGKDGPMDGRARRQPRGAVQGRRRRRRMGPRGDAGPGALEDQDQEPELHARGRTFLNKYVIIDEAQNLDAQADEDARHRARARAPRSSAPAASRRSTRPT